MMGQHCHDSTVPAPELVVAGERFLLRRRQEWFVCCQHMLLKIQS